MSEVPLYPAVWAGALAAVRFQGVAPVRRPPSVQGPGFRVQGSGCRLQGSGCRVQGAGCRLQGSGCRLQGSGCRVHCPLLPGGLVKVSGYSSRVARSGVRAALVACCGKSLGFEV